MMRRVGILVTARLDLVPISTELVEAVLSGHRDRAEVCVGAILPALWPNRALVERAFYASLEDILANPGDRLWGDRVMITREAPRRVVGSVVFHGAPDGEGAVEVAYGVEEDSQRRGYATEATRASVEWALAEGCARIVRAATPPWHFASQKVLERCGMKRCGTRDSPLGDIWEYERRLAAAEAALLQSASP
jgi:ribosomal-protein-alanine N-acetyltransferase